MILDQRLKNPRQHDTAGCYDTADHWKQCQDLRVQGFFSLPAIPCLMISSVRWKRWNMRILPSKSGTWPVRQDASPRFFRGKTFWSLEHLQENLRAHWSTYFADSTCSLFQCSVSSHYYAWCVRWFSRIPMRLSSWLTVMTRSGHRSVKNISWLWLWNGRNENSENKAASWLVSA